MTNPTLHVNKLFKYQAGNLLEDTFHKSTLKGIKKFREKGIHVLLYQ